MISLLFDCSAFEISATVQAINDVLFPIVLYAFVFWLMCNIFITDVAQSNRQNFSFDITKNSSDYKTTARRLEETKKASLDYQYGSNSIA